MTEERRPDEQKQGLVDRAVEKAQERGLVKESLVKKAREKGYIGKANDAVDKLKSRFGGR